MNPFSVSDESGELLPYARHLLDSLAFFPNDDAGQSAIRLILGLEYERWRTTEDEIYRPGHVTSVLLTDAANRSQQVWVSGLVALTMFAQHVLGEKPSQKSAVDLVCAHTARSNKHPFIFYDSSEGGFLDKDVRIQSDPASVRQLFKKHRSAAHVCAARVVCTEYLEPLRPFEEARTADRCYLATVSAFQNVFLSTTGTRDWDIRLVFAPPGLRDDAVPLLPTEALMNELLGSLG